MPSIGAQKRNLTGVPLLSVSNACEQLLKCAPQAIAKKNMTAYWDVFCEIFGMPMRVGTTFE